MVKKRAQKGSSKKLPVELGGEILPNGYPHFDVKTHFSNINFTATYSDSYVTNQLAESILGLFKAITTGESLENTPFEKLKIKLHPEFESKDVDEAWNTLLYYIHRARMTFCYALPMKLADFSDQLIVEILISIALDMEEGNVITIEGGRIHVWDYYLDELKKVLKKNWNETISRGAKYWTPEKRAGLLTLYEVSFRVLRDWWQKHHSSRNSSRPYAEDWERAEKEYPQLIPFLKALATTKPHELALEYVSQVIGLKGEHNLRKQLTLARKEAAARNE